MKLLELEAHNVGGVKEIKWDCSGHHLWLVGGPNGAGKSSAIRALLLALCGRSGADIPEPTLRIGEKSGWIKVKVSGDAAVHDLNHLTIEMELERRRDGSVKETMRVVDSVGDEAGGPRKLLQDLYASKALDPSEFDRMDKKKRRETLVKLAGLDLDTFKQQYQLLYDERKSIGADGTRLKARFEAMPSYDGVPDSILEVGKMMDELDAIRAHNKTVGVAVAYRDRKKAEVTAAQEEVKRLEEALKRAKATVKSVQSELDGAENAIASNGPEKDETALADQIKNAGEINAKIQANQSRAAVEAELIESRTKYVDLNKQLEKVVQDQETALQTANWPVPTLSVDEDGVLYDGKPWEILNQATRMYLSASIAIALNPTLRLMVIQNGSDMDTDTLVELEKLLVANDFQAIVEVVTRTPQDEQLCAVVIRDGEAV